MSLSLGLGSFAGVLQTLVAHALNMEDKKLEAQGWEVRGRQTREGRRDHHCPNVCFKFCRSTVPVCSRPLTRNLGPAITLFIMFGGMWYFMSL